LGPTLTHLNSVAVLSDPLNDQTNPKSIPGALQRYTLRIANQGAGTVDNNTIAIVDAIPANTILYVLGAGTPGSGPVELINGTPASALTYTFSGLANGARQHRFFQQRRRHLDLCADTRRERLRSGGYAHPRAPAGHDGRERRGWKSLL
jgi:hypothetical protein